MKEKIVYTYVVADLLHMGHVSYLENAKIFAEDGKLIVGVLTDKATMEKKPKPTLPFTERIRLVKALSCVDCAVAQNDYSPINNIKLIKPDILIESSSHSEEDLKHTKEITKSIGCKVIILPYYTEQSSTQIKESVKNGVEKKQDSENKTYPEQSFNYHDQIKELNQEEPTKWE